MNANENERKSSFISSDKYQQKISDQEALNYMMEQSMK